MFAGRSQDGLSFHRVGFAGRGQCDSDAVGTFTTLDHFVIRAKMLSILSGRRVRRIEWSPPTPSSSSRALIRLDPGGLLDGSLDRVPHNPRQRRPRSRNCRNFRRYGPYFQFTNRLVERQQAQLQQQWAEAQHRLQELLAEHDLLASRRLHARQYAITHAMDSVRRFYNLFCHGFDPVHHPIQSREAETFLRTLMHPDVMCTEFVGVDMFLAQYQAAIENHDSMTIMVQRLVLMDNGDDAIQIQAEATTRFRITRVTLERLFPSIIQDETLTQRLIGQEYEMQYDKVFHFAKDGRIYQHESRIDLCSSLLQLVGDPFLAIKLFEASVMTKQGHWRLGEVAEDRHALTNTLL